MPFVVIANISFGQSILELSDAGGQDTDLVMKNFRVGEDETAAGYFT